MCPDVHLCEKVLTVPSTDILFSSGPAGAEGGHKRVCVCVGEGHATLGATDPGQSGAALGATDPGQSGAVQSISAQSAAKTLAEHICLQM